MKKLSKLVFIMSLVLFVMVGFMESVMADNMPEELEGEVQEKVVEETVDIGETDETSTEDKEGDADLEPQEQVEDDKEEPIEVKDKIEDEKEPKEDKKVEEIEEDKKVEVQNIVPLSEEEHDYNFDIWISGIPLKKIEPANSKKVILKDRGDGVYNWETLMLVGFYNDKSGAEKYIYGNDLVCHVIAEEGVAAWNPERSNLNIRKPGKITLKFTTPNHKFLAPESDPYIVTINVVDEDEELNKKFDIYVESPSKISAREDLNIKATATNESEETQDALLIVALYDKSNTMITYAYSEKEVKIGETINLGAGFKLPKNSLGYKVKIFVWDSWESKNPISEMTEIEVK